MCAAGKKMMIELPLKVILTENGASNFISHRKKLIRFKLADNLDEYGISMNRFSPQSIQNMLMLEYISKIEISMPEFVSSRQEVMDYLKGNGLTHITDETNFDDAFRRNWVRGTLLPLLETKQPQIRAHLAQMAEEISALFSK